MKNFSLKTGSDDLRVLFEEFTTMIVIDFYLKELEGNFGDP